MSDLLEKLGPKQRKGSKPRCHWLTHGPSCEIATRLTKLIEPWGRVAATDRWMPEGFDNVEEAQLHRAPPLLDENTGKRLLDWWLAVVGQTSKTPNLDIASTCTVILDGKSLPGLLLVEAKAHTEELNKEETGKRLRPPVTSDCRRNHIRIGACIQDASLALTQETKLHWTLSRDWNYQMSNRFAWSWKLTELGLPVILVYLGFLNAGEMEKGKSQKPFASHDEWVSLVKSHSRPLFPEEVWNERYFVHGQAFIPLLRSVDIPFDRPHQMFEVHR